MAYKYEKLERLSARLDEESQKKAAYLIEIGYAPTDLVKQGIDLLYKKAINDQQPSIPAILHSLENLEDGGPADLSANRKKYYKELLIGKHTG